MARKSKTQAPAKPKLSPAAQHAVALNRSARALEANSAAVTTAHDNLIAALRNNTAALAASKPQKTFNQKTADAADCMSQWLVLARGVSEVDSRILTKTMTDFHIGAPQDMQRCLEWVQTCMANKGNLYHLDTTSPKANEHLNTLVNSTLAQVIADIVKNTT